MVRENSRGHEYQRDDLDRQHSQLAFGHAPHACASERGMWADISRRVWAFGVKISGYASIIIIMLTHLRKGNGISAFAL